jgi:hypothetical protein
MVAAVLASTLANERASVPALCPWHAALISEGEQANV